MSRLLFIGFFLFSFLGFGHFARAIQTSGPIVVLSDIHFYRNATVERNFLELIPCLVALHPRAVVITGDSTNGNHGDRATPETVKAWWNAVRLSLKPFETRHIPILPVAGNHDFEDEVHQQAYREAWKDLPSYSGHPPVYYSTNINGIHLSLAHIVDQELKPDVRAWLDEDLRTAQHANTKLVFGHVPFSTVLGEKVPEGFKQDLGGLLARHNVTAYIAGHEHMAWDEVFTFGDNRVRQVTVGTASASYNFPMSRRVAAAHCPGNYCILPTTHKKLALISRESRLQQKTRVFALISFDSKNGEKLPQISLNAFIPTVPTHDDRVSPKNFPFVCKGKIVPFEMN